METRAHRILSPSAFRAKSETMVLKDVNVSGSQYRARVAAVHMYIESV